LYSSCLPFLFTQMSVVTVFTSNKFLGLVSTGQSEPESNTTVGRKGEALSTVIPTIHRISFHGLSIYNNPMFWCESFLKIQPLFRT
jgi:hypothetical protein